MQGEPRYVRFADPGAGSSRLPEFAQPRCLRERPTTAEFPRRCIVRINEHGSKDRAKDASRSACDGVPCLRPVPTLIERRTTAFPSSAKPSDIRCHRRARYPRRKPLIPITSRPRPSFQRRTAKRAAFRKTRMPSAATTRKGISFAERLLPPAPTPALSSTPPTLYPQVGRVLLKGIADVTVRSPAIRDGSTRRWFESTDTFFTP
jgi:hypothetical protein